GRARRRRRAPRPPRLGLAGGGRCRALRRRRRAPRRRARPGGSAAAHGRAPLAPLGRRRRRPGARRPRCGRRARRPSRRPRRRRQLPHTPPRREQLGAMLEGNPDITRLVDPARTKALLVVRVSASQPDALEVSARVQTAIARLASVDVVELRADELPSFPSRLASELSARLAGIALRYGLPAPGDVHRRLEDAVRALDAARVEPVVRRALAD